MDGQGVLQFAAFTTLPSLALQILMRSPPPPLSSTEPHKQSLMLVMMGAIRWLGNLQLLVSVLQSSASTGWKSNIVFVVMTVTDLWLEKLVFFNISHEVIALIPWKPEHHML